MPVETTVQLDRRQTREYERALAEIKNGVPRVLSWALRRAVPDSRKRITRGLTSELAVPQKKLYQRGNRRRPVQERLHRKGANVTGGRVTIYKGRLPLGRFTPRQHWKARSSGVTRGSSGQFQSKGTARVRSRVSYKINKSGGRKRIQDAFLLEFDSGYEGIFMRQEGDSRGTVKRGGKELIELHGPSIPQVAESNSKVQRVFNVEAGEVYLARVTERTNFLLERAARA